MEIDSLYRDMVAIEKPNGDSFGPVKASVQKGKIHLQATHPVEPGDVLVREMPFGKPERYVVDEPNYIQGLGRIPAHFEATVTRESKAKVEAMIAGRDMHPAQDQGRAPAQITYNVYGGNARFNQNSTDNSMNVTIESSDGVFEDLKSELRANVDDPQRIAELEAIISDMQASQHDSKGMSEKLGQLISKGSDLMGIIGPFVPMLTGIATGTSS